MIKAHKAVRTHKGFDRLSPVYDLMLKLTSGNAILKSQTTLLHILPSLNTVLIVGGGTGSFLIELLKRKDIYTIIYVDSSEGMILETKKKIQKKTPQSFSKIHFVHGTIDDLAPEKTFDAIFTNYFLDLFKPDELKLVLQKTYSLLSPNGYWYITDFAYPDERLSGLRSLIYKTFHWLLYFFFRTLCGISGRTIPDLKTELNTFKMNKLNERDTLNRLLWCGVYQRS